MERIRCRSSAMGKVDRVDYRLLREHNEISGIRIKRGEIIKKLSLIQKERHTGIITGHEWIADMTKKLKIRTQQETESFRYFSLVNGEVPLQQRKLNGWNQD